MIVYVIRYGVLLSEHYIVMCKHYKGLLCRQIIMMTMRRLFSRKATLLRNYKYTYQALMTDDSRIVFRIIIMIIIQLFNTVMFTIFTVMHLIHDDSFLIIKHDHR